MTHRANDENSTPENPLSTLQCTSASELRFAYLNLRDHPRGQLMLERLIEHGFTPAIVIEEASHIADIGRADQMRELRQSGDLPSFDATEAFCRDRGIAHLLTSSHNDTKTLHALRGGDFPLIVLGDTRVLRQEIISTASSGVINIHPGVLPEVRGNTPYIWSIIHDLPQGVTAHLVNAEVDKGPILHGRRLHLRDGMTYPQLVSALNQLCAQVLVETLLAVIEKRIHPRIQPDDHRLTFRKAPQQIRAIAAEMLLSRQHADAAHQRPPIESRLPL